MSCLSHTSHWIPQRKYLGGKFNPTSTLVYGVMEEPSDGLEFLSCRYEEKARRRKVMPSRERGIFMPTHAQECWT